MNPHPPTLKHVSECFIKAKYSPEESKKPYYLSSWDLAMLSTHYIQKGLLYAKPPEAHHSEHFINALLDKLKHSLSIALVHFYPFTGRLSTINYEHEASCAIYVNCNNSPGAKFIHARLDMTIYDILLPTDVPLIVQSLFDHDRAVNNDGHTMPLLSIQVTELLDGIFIGCSISHTIADGTSYWHFFNIWSEIFQAHDDDNISISRPPVLQRWFPDGHGPILKLPYTHPDQFISRFEAPQLRERFFYFSSKSLAILKAKANTECKTNKISSFQALSALVWRCITRARCLPDDQITSCRLAANNRARLKPPLSENYFGNSMQPIRGFTTAGELMGNNLGWAAWKLHEAVLNHTDATVRDNVDRWLQSPTVYQIGQLFDQYSVMMGSSSRFNKYGNVFGMGKPLALRSGYANKFDGKVTCYPGSEGGGSIDLELCLPPNSMSALEVDEEFMDATSSYNPLD